MKRGSRNDSYDCTFKASRTRMALRRLPFESSAIFPPTSGGKSNGTFFATYARTVFIYDKGNVREESIQHRTGTRTSSASGAATRINRHRLLIGEIRRLVLLAQRMIRMLDMYFSIVLRRAACASRDRESASLITTTERQIPRRGHITLEIDEKRRGRTVPLNLCLALRSTCCVWAISFRSS